MRIKELEFANLKYLKDPQLLYELMISLIISSKNIDRIKKNDSRILVTPSEDYIYTGSIQWAWYHVLSRNKKLTKIILIDYKKNINDNNIIIPSYDKFETPFWEIHTTQEYKNFFQEFKILKDNNHFEKNYKIETQLPFIKGILNIEYFLPCIISENIDSKLFENILETIYKKDKNTWIIILGEQWKWIEIEKEKTLIKNITKIWEWINNFCTNNNLNIEPISFIKNKSKIFFSVTI